MGISTLLWKNAGKYFIKPCRLIELGNQCFYYNGKEDKATQRYFSNECFDYTSIDINGKDNAYQLDLCKDIIMEPADIVTNFGTSEHVENQFYCFKNIHNLCKLNGLMLHEVPEKNSWSNHGLYYYTEEFFKKLQIKNGYELIEKHKHFYDKEGYLLFYVFKKIKDIKFNFVDIKEYVCQ